MTIVLSDTIAIDGKVVETVKSVGLTPKISAIPVRPLLDPISSPSVSNITIDSSGIISSSGGSGGTTYDIDNRLNYEFISAPTVEIEGIVNIVEPTSSPSVPITTIDNEYKYMTFTNITPNIIYDFTNRNSLVSWRAYANTIPNATHDITDYNGSLDGVWINC